MARTLPRMQTRRLTYSLDGDGPCRRVARLLFVLAACGLSSGCYVGLNTSQSVFGPADFAPIPALEGQYCGEDGGGKPVDRMPVQFTHRGDGLYRLAGMESQSRDFDDPVDLGFVSLPDGRYLAAAIAHPDRTATNYYLLAYPGENGIRFRMFKPPLVGEAGTATAAILGHYGLSASETGTVTAEATTKPSANEMKAFFTALLAAMPAESLGAREIVFTRLEHAASCARMKGLVRERAGSRRYSLVVRRP